MMTTNPDFRASPQLAEAANALGPLIELVGNWVGKGFNLVLVPAKGRDPPFRRVINPTIELLAFTPLGALIPNRGSIQDTIFSQDCLTFSR